MALVLPYPTQPASNSALASAPVLANITALAQAIQAFDATQVVAGSLQASAFATGINPNTIMHDTHSPFVLTGCIWAQVSGLNGTMTSGIAYIANSSSMFRLSVAGVGSYTFTASQDTYIDIDYNGNIYYQAVSNGASAPSLTANAIRVAKVVTNGSAITSVLQQGYDSNFVSIYPQSPDKPAKYVDANGWTVYDNGKYKQYGQSYTSGAGIPANSSLQLLTNANFPVGTTYASLRFAQLVNNPGAFVELVKGNMQTGGTATTFNFWLRNDGAGSTGLITVSIMAWDA